MSAAKSIDISGIEAEMAMLGFSARAAAQALATTTVDARRAAIEAVADALAAGYDEILVANAEDMADARAAKLNAAMLDRLALDNGRVGAMISGMREVVKLDDPLGRVLGEWTRPNGLRIERVDRSDRHHL